MHLDFLGPLIQFNTVLSNGELFYASTRSEGYQRHYYTVDSCYNKLIGSRKITVVLKFCYTRVVKTIKYKANLSFRGQKKKKSLL